MFNHYGTTTTTRPQSLFIMRGFAIDTLFAIYRAFPDSIPPIPFLSIMAEVQKHQMIACDADAREEGIG